VDVDLTEPSASQVRLGLEAWKFRIDTDAVAGANASNVTSSGKWTYGGAQYLPSWEQLWVSWLPFHDDTSSVSYAVCVGTEPLGHDMLPCTWVGSNLSYSLVAGQDAFDVTAMELMLRDGDMSNDVNTRTPILPTAVATVIGINDWGLTVSSTSQVVAFDVHPPRPSGGIFDGPKPGTLDVDVQSTIDPIAAWWEPFEDFQTRVVTYHIAVGTTHGGEEVLEFLDIGLTTEWVGHDLPLHSGTTYYVTVKAIDAVGHYSTITTDGVTVDGTAPLPVIAMDCASSSCVDEAKALAQDLLESEGIAALLPSSLHDALVQEVMGAMSNKSELPEMPAEMEAQVGPVRAQGARLDAVWAFLEDGTDIAACQWALCPVFEGFFSDAVDAPQPSVVPCVVPWSSAPAPQILEVDAGRLSVYHVSLTDIEVEPGVHYELRARATNEVGLRVYTRTAGFNVDATPPVEDNALVADVAARLTPSGDAVWVLPQEFGAPIAVKSMDTHTTGIHLETEAGIGADVIGSVLLLGVTWTGFVDRESGIQGYTVCAGSAPGRTDVHECVHVSAVETAVALRIDPSTLPEVDEPYVFATVTAYNGAGLTASLTTDGVMVDLSAPVAGRVAAGPPDAMAPPTFITHPTTLDMHWSDFVD
jgi:hypothetical protein